MDSPFPGMDPYLERDWGDVHQRLITYASDQVQVRLPLDLRARVQERIVIEPPGGEAREIYPDVHVVERARREAGVGAALAVAEDLAEPLVVLLDDEPAEGFIEIVEAGARHRVVSVIEVLSLSNKRGGRDQEKYLETRDDLADAGISVLEIDLLRAGRRMLAAPLAKIPPSHRTTYQICVRRGWRPGAVEVYRAPLQERLPKIRVSLRRSDADVPLDLQTLVDQCYRNGRYDDIDYRADPDPPLDPPDAEWADALLRGRGRRP